jgi:dipeptidase D
VKTSSNLGIADQGRIVAKPRSSDFAALRKLISNQSELFRSRGATVEDPVAFPAWKESDDSELVKLASDTYRDYFGCEPRVVVTHGGLESSTIKDKHPGMEAISIGPTVLGAHTPDEKIDLRTLTEAKGYLFELIHRLSE